LYAVLLAAQNLSYSQSAEVFMKIKISHLFAAFWLHAACAQAGTDIGGFTGSPYDTWDGLKRVGIEVRNFEQANLLQPNETSARRYLQYVPRSIQNKRHHKKNYPLVIMLPGGDLSAELGREWDWGDRMEQLAEREKFILVYANAYGPSSLTEQNSANPIFANGGYWRTCFGKPGASQDFFSVDDVAYLRKIIQRVKREGLPVDRSRVYLLGMSNGGEMVQRAAREMGDQLAGVGAVMPVSTPPATVELATCAKRSQLPLPMMFIYSPKDTLLDWFYGNIGLNYADFMKETLHQWRDAMGINASTQVVRQLPNRVEEGSGYAGNAPWAIASMNSQITRYDYQSTAAGADLSVLEIQNAAGHAWPNSADTPHDVAEQPRNGFKNQDINAEQVIWKFFKEQRNIY
jgi:polyhydroxybutyrate depolymerase